MEKFMTEARIIMDKFVEVFSIIIMGSMTLLVTWQVITRFVLKNPSTVTEQLSRYGFVWLVLINAAYVFGQRGHMNITFLVHKMSDKMQTICAIIGELMVLIFVVVVLIIGGSQNVKVGINTMDAALPITMGYLYLALPIAGVMTTIYSILNLHDLILSLSKKKTL